MDAVVRSGCGDLPAKAAFLYRTLGLHPGREFSVGVACAAVEGDAASVSELLKSLVSANLLHEIRESRFCFAESQHEQAQTCARAVESESNQLTALRRMLEWYLHAIGAARRRIIPHMRIANYEFVYQPDEPVEFSDCDDALAWLDVENVNLATAVRKGFQSGLDALAWNIASGMWPLFLYRKQHQQGLTVDQVALKTSRRWAEQLAEAKVLSTAGANYPRAGQFEGPMRYFHDALALRSRAKDNRTAGVLDSVSAACFADGRLEESVEYSHQALAIYRATGEKRGEGLTLCRIGQALLALNRSDQGITCLEQARTIFTHGKSADPQELARVLVVLGDAYTRAHRYAEAAVIEGTLTSLNIPPPQL